MGVLESMRSSSDSTFMQVVLVLVVVSFVGWYAVPQGDKTSVVATVNGVRIMDTEFRREFSRAKYSQEQSGRMMSEEEEKALSEEVRQALVETEAVLQAARKMGLEVSQYEIDSAILAIDDPNPGEPVLRRQVTDDTGRLDPAKWATYLERVGMNEGDYQDMLRRQILFNKVRGLVFASTSIPDTMLQELFEQRQRQVDVTYARVRASAFYTAVEVTDAQIDAFLLESGERVQAAYDRDFEARYKHAEQLHLSMIRMVKGADPAEVLPKMNEVVEAAKAGADFGDLARKWSEHQSAEQGGDLGKKPVLQLAPEMTEAVAGLAAGELSRVITGVDDLRLYKLHERVAPYEETFDQVKRDIATRLIREDQAPRLAADFAEKELLPAWTAAGAPPTDLLAGKQLTSATTGLVPVGGGNPFGPPADLMAAAARAEKGEVLPKVYEAQGVLWVGQVTDKKDADLSEFAAQRDQIAGQELFQRRQQVFDGWVTDVVAQATVE